MQRKTEARDLPTSFDEEPPKKNKAPLVGPPTAKNKHKRRREPQTDSDSDEQQLPEKTPKRREKVVSSDSDLDDNTLGITPRTPPESPFYRGPASHGATLATNTSKNKKPKQKATVATSDPQKEKKKDKTKKTVTPLQQLAQDEDDLYKKLNKNTSK